MLMKKLMPYLQHNGQSLLAYLYIKCQNKHQETFAKYIEHPPSIPPERKHQHEIDL